MSKVKKKRSFQPLAEDEDCLQRPLLDCNAFYIGKTKRTLHDRKMAGALQSSHLSWSRLRDGSIVADNSTLASIGNNIKRDHFKILASGQCDSRCKIKETLFPGHC